MFSVDRSRIQLVCGIFPNGTFALATGARPDVPTSGCSPESRPDEQNSERVRQIQHIPGHGLLSMYFGPPPAILTQPHTPHNPKHSPVALQISPSSSIVTQVHQRAPRTNPNTMKTSFYAAAGLVAAVAGTAQASTPALTAQVSIVHKLLV